MNRTVAGVLGVVALGGAAFLYTRTARAAGVPRPRRDRDVPTWRVPEDTWDPEKTWEMPAFAGDEELRSAYGRAAPKRKRVRKRGRRTMASCGCGG